MSRLNLKLSILCFIKFNILVINLRSCDDSPALCPRSPLVTPLYPKSINFCINFLKSLDFKKSPLYNENIRSLKNWILQHGSLCWTGHSQERGWGVVEGGFAAFHQPKFSSLLRLLAIEIGYNHQGFHPFESPEGTGARHLWPARMYSTKIKYTICFLDINSPIKRC